MISLEVFAVGPGGGGHGPEDRQRPVLQPLLRVEGAADAGVLALHEHPAHLHAPAADVDAARPGDALPDPAFGLPAERAVQSRRRGLLPSWT